MPKGRRRKWAVSGRFVPSEIEAMQTALHGCMKSRGISKQGALLFLLSRAPETPAPVVLTQKNLDDAYLEGQKAGQKLLGRYKTLEDAGYKTPRKLQAKGRATSKIVRCLEPGCGFSEECPVDMYLDSCPQCWQKWQVGKNLEIEYVRAPVSTQA